jgi:hypothetical protein
MPVFLSGVDGMGKVYTIRRRFEGTEKKRTFVRTLNVRTLNVPTLPPPAAEALFAVKTSNVSTF